MLFFLKASPRENPPTKRVKLDTSSNSFGKDNELNLISKKDTIVKDDVNAKNDTNSKNVAKPKSLGYFFYFNHLYFNLVKSNVVFDENGSIDESDMEDESEMDLDDEEDGESLGLDDSENADEDDSVMDEEDDSLILDEEEDETESLLDSSTGLL